MMMLQLILLLLLIRTTASRHTSTENTADKDNTHSDQHEHLIELSTAQSDRLLQLFVDRNVAIRMQLHTGAGHQQFDGTLLSIYSGRRLILELDIDDGQFSFKYRTTISGGGSIKVYKASQRPQLADGNWHQLLLSIDGERLLLIVDCQHVLLNKSDRDFASFQHPPSSVIGYIGQQSSRRRLFNGSIREFSADEGSPIGDATNCPQLTSLSTEIDETTATTIIDDEVPDEVPDEVEESVAPPSIIDQMQTRIDHLERQFKHWKSIIHRHSAHIRNVQLHQRGCRLGDRRLMIGEKLSFHSPNCTVCHCTLGGVLDCGRIGCAPLTCRTPLPPTDDNDCCPHCGRRCYYSGVDYEHGDEFWPKPCVQCSCVDGTMDCRYHRVDECPQLYCTETYTPANRCCPICENYDHCNGEPSPCDANARCTSERDGARCECKEGYFGDAYRHCYDVDECASDGGGCGHGTQCINTEGAFRCDCLPGTVRIDANNCIDAM